MEENQNTKTDSSYGKPTLSGLSQTVLNTPLPSPQQLPGYQLLLSASPSLSQLLYSGRPQATQTPITQSQQPITLGSLLNSAATSASLLFWSTHMSGGYFSYDISYLRHLPIKIANRDKQDEVIMLVRKIVALNEEYDRLGDERREHRQEINERLAQLEKQLDEVVYKIYGLTTEEKNIIDDSLGRELVMENDGGEEIIED